MQSLCKKVDYLLICTLPNKSINQSMATEHLSCSVLIFL